MTPDSEAEAQAAAERQAQAEHGTGRVQERAPEWGAERLPEEPGEGVHIPLSELSAAALGAIVEEFVTRDGTEHTEGERKVAQMMAVLERGEAEIWFNERTRTCNILRVDGRRG